MKKINRDYFYNPQLVGLNPLFIEVGLWTIENLVYLNKAHPNCRLQGYECDPDNFSTLINNNTLPNLKVFNTAIGWNTGKTEFYKYQYPAWHSKYPKHEYDKGREIKAVLSVDTVTITEAITGKVDLLLLNCEGCEIAVMDSLINNEALRHNIKQLCTSFHENKCYKKEVKDKYLSLMEKYYDVHINKDNEVVYYLFIPK